ncbi:MAG TPA: AzlD domain-containing protein [Candidatus Binatia bacterium]|jgi:branched-subunit amino acid transport protein
MAPSRLTIIVGMALVSYALRVIPQLLLTGWGFPPAWDRYLRYLAYGLVASIVSTTLFLSGARFDVAAAPRRTIALAIAVAVAVMTRNAAAGMLIGTIAALLLSWMAA